MVFQKCIHPITARKDLLEGTQLRNAWIYPYDLKVLQEFLKNDIANIRVQPHGTKITCTDHRSQGHEQV